MGNVPHRPERRAEGAFNRKVARAGCRPGPGRLAHTVDTLRRARMIRRPKRCSHPTPSGYRPVKALPNGYRKAPARTDSPVLPGTCAGEMGPQ